MKSLETFIVFLRKMHLPENCITIAELLSCCIVGILDLYAEKQMDQQRKKQGYSRCALQRAKHAVLLLARDVFFQFE